MAQHRSSAGRFGTPALTLFALMMLAHTLSDGTADLGRASMLHGVSVLFGGAAIATGWFTGHRGWLLLTVPIAVTLALIGAPEPRSVPVHLNIGLVALYSALSIAGLLQFVTKPTWPHPARA